MRQQRITLLGFLPARVKTMPPIASVLVSQGVQTYSFFDIFFHFYPKREYKRTP